MNADLLGLINGFAGVNVLVIGDALLDGYIDGYTDKLCREAPVPVISVGGKRNIPGGAANTAANVRSLGARVQFLSVVGDDPEGDALVEALEEHGIAREHILVRQDRKTLSKHRIMAGSQMIARLDQGTTAPVDMHTEDELIDRMNALFPAADVVIVSDYCCGLFTPRVIMALGELQAKLPRILVVDSKNALTYRSLRPAIVKPNYGEALELLGIKKPLAPTQRVALMEANGPRLLELTGAHIVAVTLDTDGALIFEPQRPMYRTYSRPRPDTNATGAGDTFVSAFSLALAVGADTPAAAELASAAAGVVVEKNDTSVCSAGELKGSVTSTSKRLRDLSTLETVRAYYRDQGQKLIFTNGCFDILHRGHITYLSQAKALGGILIVGVNSDESVRRLKGRERPINTMEDRIQVLSALSCVDHVIGFEEDTADNIIRALRPDIFVKGGDYTFESLPEARLVESLGGTVKIFSFIENISTTGIIRQIKKTPATGTSAPAPDETARVPVKPGPPL